MRTLVFVAGGRVEERMVKSVLLQAGDNLYFDLMMTHDNPHTESPRHVYQNIQLNYEKMKHAVRDGSYDKVWIVESDTIVPQGTLRKLLEVDADIVSGLYIMRHGTPVANIFQWGALQNGLGRVFSKVEIAEHWGEMVRISGGCMGCILADRKTIIDFDFEVEGHYAAPDMPWMQWCCEKNFVQMARLDVLCGHIRPNGDVLWPDKEKGYRIEEH